VAEKFDTDSKTLRRFLRAKHSDEKPGQGGRWSIDAKKLPALKKEFDAWVKAEADRKAKAAEAKAESGADKVKDNSDRGSGLPKSEQAKAEHKTANRRPRAGKPAPNSDTD
jgi:hypothetical protein